MENLLQLDTPVKRLVLRKAKEKFQKDQKEYMIVFGISTILFALLSTYYYVSNHFELLTNMSITFGLAMFFMGLFYGFWFHKVMQEKYEKQEKSINE